MGGDVVRTGGEALGKGLAVDAACADTVAAEPLRLPLVPHDHPPRGAAKKRKEKTRPSEVTALFVCQEQTWVPVPRGDGETIDMPGPGTMLGDRYLLEGQLGSGGCGVVFSAKDTLLYRQVAVKVLTHELAADRDSLLRFHREAVAAGRVQHPGVVRVLDFVADDQRGNFLVMEYLDGEDLRAEISRRQQEQKPFSEAGALEISAQIARALTATHKLGIVHCDLKPSNVFLATSGDEFVTKLLDFGISKLLHSAAGAQTTTATNMVLGTPAYMSPEQACGRAVDARADVYALGVILYELLAGQRPFCGDGAMDVLAKHALETPEPMRTHRSDVSPSVERILGIALQKDPDERFPSMDLFAEALEGCLAEQTAVPVALPAPRGSTFVANRATVLALFGALSVLALALIWFGRGEVASESSTDSQVVTRVIDDSTRGGGEPVEVSVAAPSGDLRGVAGAGENSDADRAGDNSDVQRAGDNSDADRAGDNSDAQRAGDNSDVQRAENGPTRVKETRSETARRVGARSATPPQSTKRARKPRGAGSRVAAEPSPEAAATMARDGARGKPTSIPTPEPAGTAPKPARVPTAAPAPAPAAAAAEPEVRVRGPGSMDASVSLTAFSVTGPVPRSSVKRAVSRHLGRYRACYRKAARKARNSPPSSVKVTLYIDSNNAVGRASVKGGMPGLAACVREVSNSTRLLSAPDVGGVRLRFKVNFRPTK